MGGYKPPEGVVVKGKVVKGGKTLDVPNREVGLGRVVVYLVPLGGGEAKDAPSALADAQGNFQVQGAGRGIPPGKYRVSVLQQDKGPESDLLKGEFSQTKSPVEVEIPAKGGTHDLGTIDLDQPKK
jgi:hypothetical protein